MFSDAIGFIGPRLCNREEYAYTICLTGRQRCLEEVFTHTTGHEAGRVFFTSKAKEWWEGKEGKMMLVIDVLNEMCTELVPEVELFMRFHEVVKGEMLLLHKMNCEIDVAGALQWAPIARDAPSVLENEVQRAPARATL